MYGNRFKSGFLSRGTLRFALTPGGGARQGETGIVHLKSWRGERAGGGEGRGVGAVTAEALVLTLGGGRAAYKNFVQPVSNPLIPPVTYCFHSGLGLERNKKLA